MIDSALTRDTLMLSDDVTLLEGTFGLLLPDMDAATSRETARLLRAATRDQARTNAIPRLTRAKRILDDASVPLTTLATLSTHAALLATLPVLDAIGATFQAAAAALATRGLEPVLVDRTLPGTPTETQLRATLEGMAGAFALANGEPETAFAAALPLYRDIGAFATTLTALEAGALDAQWRAMALLTTARAARGAYDGSGNPASYAHDTRLFLASLAAARANQLEVRAKLGVES